MIEQKDATIGVLREAAEIMEKYGYVRGYRGPCNPDTYMNGEHCALGAIDVIRRRQGGGYLADGEDPAKKALAEMITPLIPEEGMADTYNGHDFKRNSSVGSKIAGWSNMIALSKEKVSCAMRAAAEFLEEGQEGEVK